MRNDAGNELLKQLAAVQERRKIRRKRRYRRSKLEAYRAELVALNRAGASLNDILHWLREVQRCRVSRTTLWRYLRQLPESGNC